MKQLTRKELTDIVAKMDQQLARIENSINVLDKGTLLALYSLVREDRIHFPENSDADKKAVTDVLSKVVETFSGEK